MYDIHRNHWKYLLSQVTVLSFAVTRIKAVLRCWGGFLNLLCWPYCFRLSAHSAAGTWFQSSGLGHEKFMSDYFSS